MTEQSKHLSERITEWAANLRWEQIPTAVQERSLTTLRDTISVILAGTTTTSARIAAEYARRNPGPFPLAAGGSSVASLAAFANGVAGSALDYDDGHYLGGAIHPSSPTLAAAFIALQPTTTIRDLLTAHVAGLEVALRAAALLWQRTPEDWYHSAGCSGTLGASTATGHLLGFNPEQMQRALVIGWQHAPMASCAYPMIKEAIGWGAASGATAAGLAELGWHRIAGDQYPPNPHHHASNPFDRDGVSDNPYVTSFGEVFEAGNTYFKTYPACRYTHASITGMLALRERHGLTPDDIEAIDIHTIGIASGLNDPAPLSIEHAQYSMPFTVASAAVAGVVGPRQISEDQLTNPEVVKLSHRIRVIADPELDPLYPTRYPSRIRVTTTKGETLEEYVADAPDDAVPLTEKQLHDKWIDALTMVISESDASALIDALGDLDAPAQQVLAPVWQANEATAGRARP